jgi:hypothetical protein
MQNQTAEIESLIQTHKEEGKKYGLSDRTLIYWIIFRIIDYFYRLLIDGNTDQTLKDYCELLVKSSLMKDFNYNTIQDLINDFEHDININYDIQSIINENENINTKLNLYMVIDILKNCRKSTKYAGARKSRRKISKINKLSKKNVGRKR